MTLRIGSTTEFDLSQPKPFTHPDYRDALLHAWKSTDRKNSLTRLAEVANCDHAGRYRRGQSKSVIECAQQHWTIHVSGNVEHVRGVDSASVHLSEMLDRARLIRPQRPSPRLEGQRISLSPILLGDRTPVLTPTWHYAGFVQVMWAGLFTDLPQPYVRHPDQCWTRLLQLRAAYGRSTGIQTWQHFLSRRRERTSYALALYESTLWLLSQQHRWPDKRADALRRLALHTIHSCYSVTK